MRSPTTVIPMTRSARSAARGCERTRPSANYSCASIVVLFMALLSACKSASNGGGPVRDVHAESERILRDALADPAATRQPGSSTPGVAPPPQVGTPNSSREQLARVIGNGDAQSQTVARALVNEVQRSANTDDQRRNFQGLSFGVAPSIIFGGKKAIKSAKIVNSDGADIVRVTEENSDDIALLLEAHYFFMLDSENRYGIGPFLAIKPGDGEIINGMGAGVMAGARYLSAEGTSAKSFNIGFGPFLQRNAQVLADGFYDGEPPPEGEEQVEFKTEDVWRWTVTFSFSWSF